MQKSLPSHIRNYRHGNILAHRYGNECDGNNDDSMLGALPGALHSAWQLWRRRPTYVNNYQHFFLNCTKTWSTWCSVMTLNKHTQDDTIFSVHVLEYNSSVW